MDNQSISQASERASERASNQSSKQASKQSRGYVFGSTHCRLAKMHVFVSFMVRDGDDASFIAREDEGRLGRAISFA